jgi:uncharacterized protein (DUF1778 family)
MEQNRAEIIRTESVTIWLSGDQKQLLRLCARQERKSLSEWSRNELVRAAKDRQAKTEVIDVST